VHQAAGQALARAVHVALARWSQTLAMVHLTAQLQATAYTVHRAGAGFVLGDRAIAAREAVHALTVTVVAISLAIAVLGTGLEGAIMSGEAGVASARSINTGAGAGAVTLASDLTAVVATISGAAEASAVEAVAVRSRTTGCTLLE